MADERDEEAVRSAARRGPVAAHIAKGRIAAPAITPDSLRRCSDEELAAIIKKGRRPDGSMLEGPMPVGAHAHLAPGDVRALVACLRKG